MRKRNDDFTCRNGGVVKGNLIDGCGCDCYETDYNGDQCENKIKKLNVVIVSASVVFLILSGLFFFWKFILI